MTRNPPENPPLPEKPSASRDREGEAPPRPSLLDTGEQGQFTTTRWSVALAAAHRIGVIHRDLKPHNLTLNGAGLVKLMDLGLARRNEYFTEGLTAAGDVMGTPAFMSPEQARGSEVDARSDLFSAGATLYRANRGQETANRGQETIFCTRIGRPLRLVLGLPLSPQRRGYQPLSESAESG